MRDTFEVGEGLVCAEGEIREMEVAHGCIVGTECGGVVAEILLRR